MKIEAYHFFLKDEYCYSLTIHSESLQIHLMDEYGTLQLH